MSHVCCRLHAIRPLLHNTYPRIVLYSFVVCAVLFYFIVSNKKPFSIILFSIQFYSIIFPIYHNELLTLNSILYYLLYYSILLIIISYYIIDFAILFA